MDNEKTAKPPSTGSLAASGDMTATDLVRLARSMGVMPSYLLQRFIQD